MKKVLLAMLMTSMLILVGCGENKDEGVFQATGKGLDTAVEKTGETAGTAVDATGKTAKTAVDATGKTTKGALDATGNFFKKTTDKTASLLKCEKKTSDANTVKDVNGTK
ncbi:MAG: hypothetical protein LLF92_00420 [Planctomycetaceae bacterium]|nr:hypothetical protein [Planctomycetaceae bacterium]